MSLIGVIEMIAWLLSAAIAIWMAQDMFRVSRTHDEASLVNAPDHDEASLVNAPDPLEEPVEPQPGRERA